MADCRKMLRKSASGPESRGLVKAEAGDAPRRPTATAAHAIFRSFIGHPSIYIGIAQLALDYDANVAGGHPPSRQIQNRPQFPKHCSNFATPSSRGGRRRFINTLPRKSLLRSGGGWQARRRSVEGCHCAKSER